MDKWDVALKDVVQHNEKKEQQAIAIANRADTDYVVLDLEYAVSKQSEFAYDGGDDKKVPRFDIIAIRNGRLFVIELKKGLGATPGKSGIKSHMKCYNHTIGRDDEHFFVKEMQALLKQKQELGLLDKTLTIEDTKPEFIFAFADKKDKDDFEEFAKRCFDVGYEGNFIYIGNNHKLTAKMSRRKYYYAERRKQEALYDDKFWGSTPNGGHWTIFENGQKIKVVKNLPYILHQNYSKENLYVDIREDALLYFDQNNISWWRQQEDNYYPTGHLVSSQIHCLNHLFAIRKDDNAIKQLLKKATDIEFDKILPTTIDRPNDGYIAFEFALDNEKLLGETDEGAQRGAMCTSIDAMIRAQKDDKIWLIPIEWKYTETYKREDKTNQIRLNRYKHLIECSERLKTPTDGISHSVYFIEPNYELMRQTLLCEQLVTQEYAHTFFHINVIPSANTELRNAVEKEFIPMLKEEAKFRIIDPQELLSPIPADGDYKDLISYLQTRYWKK